MRGIALALVLAALPQCAWADEPSIDTLANGVRAIVEPHPGSRTFSLRVVLAGGVEEGGANRRYVESVQERIRRAAGLRAIEVVGYVRAEGLDGAFADAAESTTRHPRYAFLL